jgi:hypothetical protein
MKAGSFCTLALLSFAFLTACNFVATETAGPMMNEPVSVDGGTADHANVELNMRAGEMKVSGGGTKLLEGTVEYNVARWKPEISSTKNGDHATVTIRQPEAGASSLGGKTRNIWDLQLANKTLLDLTVNCGAGQANLYLGDVLLRSLNVQIGAGQLDLDLTGKPRHDYDVTVQGGVGQATVHLPENVGIWATAHGGIGSINVTGLEKHGDHWQNSLYDNAKVNVKIEVNGGIGEVRLIG